MRGPPRGKTLPRVAYLYCINIQYLTVFQLKCCLDGSLYFLLLYLSHAAIVLDFPSLPQLGGGSGVQSRCEEGFKKATGDFDQDPNVQGAATI